ncbi:extracellular solute-binding protein [Pullulanibacillus sp. KACC 23026]|uniref:ABC transporter substrate-binding protein n=1 Tax=Pullulanibacillus sp. KACC 23026 TaxID=3028315 RepID=UPI0031B5EA7C
MRKFAPIVMVVLMLSIILSGCSTGNSASTGNSSSQTSSSKNGKVTITFWAAPNPTQVTYWKDMAKKFMAANPNIVVNVSPMKESPTSEASIQAAIAGGNAPTASENISRSFAAQLAQSKAIVPLDQMNGYNKIISERHMNNTIQGWKFTDGHQYVLPVYSNAMLFAWRIDILKKLGFNQPPKTYSQVLDLADKLKAKYPNKFLWASNTLVDPTAYQRWFDFFMLYDAASNGNSFISGNSFVADDKAGTQVLDLMSQLQKKNALLTSQSKNPFETGLGVFESLGPWSFSTWDSNFPSMQLNKTYALSTPPVPDNYNSSTVKTFADTKGIAIYSSAPKPEQQAALKFISWVFSNPENDLELLKTTSLPPARDDLESNSTFKSYFEAHPEMKPYAAEIPYAVPSIDNANYNNLQTLIGNDAFIPVVKGQTTPQNGWDKMKSDIKGALN